MKEEKEKQLAKEFLINRAVYKSLGEDDELFDRVGASDLIDFAKQYHSPAESVDELREKFYERVKVDGLNKESQDSMRESINDIFDFFLPHLQKQDNVLEAMDFEDVFEFNNWVKKYAVPDHENGVDKWQTWSKRNLTVKELYKEYIKTKNK